MKVEVVRDKAYIDISIGGVPTGRIVLELYDDLAPKASENFLNLCTNKTGLSYKNTYFHRVLKNFVIQAGDINNSKDLINYPSAKIGTGNISTFGLLFEDENITEPLDEPFKLCMANDGNKNANGSQFFITTYPQPHLTGKHTVFGKVIHGKSVVREIERVNTNNENIPKKEEIVLIESCGQWNDGEEIPIYNACYDTVGGDIYEEYPDDDENIDKESSESVYNASVKIKDSGSILFKNGEKRKAFLKYKKCIRYVMEYIPDEDQEPEWNRKYLELKKKLYLNLSLTSLQLKNYSKAIDYSSYLLAMDNAIDQDKAKAYYRRGLSLLENRKYQEALDDFHRAKALVPGDVAIERELSKVESLLEQKRLKDKQKYAKFFT